MLAEVPLLIGVSILLLVGLTLVVDAVRRAVRERGETKS
jgi:hypothetical protein